uniref:cysteine hydrolase family protein n=1 Tax=Marinobacterium profundum TaxID=1714300 RepID=UPI0008329DC0|nr:cysteine hydrolase family protein [Marinobacterium profundum]
MVDLSKTALLLIGFQNDYFSKDGILHGVIEESSRVSGVLQNTLGLLDIIGDDFGLVVSTPIHFTAGYEELADPVGILKTIKEVGAFKAGCKGSRSIDELKPFGRLITEVPGKRGLNAFSNTQLEDLLRSKGIERLVLAGTVTSICIDSTARHAAELGFRVTVLSDCTSGRTIFEQEFYCDSVFPLYASVSRAADLITG